MRGLSIIIGFFLNFIKGIYWVLVILIVFNYLMILNVFKKLMGMVMSWVELLFIVCFFVKCL